MIIQEELTLNRSVENVSKIFSDIAKVIFTAVGRPWGFLSAAAAVILWGTTGPIIFQTHGSSSSILRVAL